MASTLGALIGDFTATLFIAVLFAITGVILGSIWNFALPFAAMPLYVAFLAVILTRISISFAGRMLF